MASDLVVVVVGAGCAAIGALASSVIASAVERRRSLSNAGRPEVAAKQRMDRHEAITQLAGLMTKLNHHLAWISRDDGARLQEGRVQAARQATRQLRDHVRSEVANVGPDVFDAIIRATDIATILLDTAASEPGHEVARLRHQWLEQLDVTASAMADETRGSIKVALQSAWAAGGGTPLR